MEKLIKKYNKECNIMSKKANRLQKVGQIIITLIYSLYSVVTQRIVLPFLIYSICMVCLYFICEYINMKYIQAKLKIKEFILKDIQEMIG